MELLELLRRSVVGRRVRITHYPHEEPRHVVGPVVEVVDYRSGNVSLVVGDADNPSDCISVWDIRVFEFVD